MSNAVIAIEDIMERVTKRGEYIVINDSACIGWKLKIGNFVRIGAGCEIENNVTIKDGCILAEETKMCENSFMGPNCCTLREQDGSIGGATIGKNAFIGAGCIIFPGVMIGDGAIIGAGSIVRHDVDENQKVYGVV